ncbi:MAG: hypothetical protein ACO3LE_04095 [Bdellovibrionota bacterium]
MNLSDDFEKRPYIGLMFECCRVYSRIYRKKEDQHYKGFCPKCGRAVSLRVDPRKGSKSKFWRVL